MRGSLGWPCTTLHERPRSYYMLTTGADIQYRGGHRNQSSRQHSLNINELFLQLLKQVYTLVLQAEHSKWDVIDLQLVKEITSS
jgi:hypothetical protein